MLVTGSYTAAAKNWNLSEHEKDMKLLEKRLPSWEESFLCKTFNFFESGREGMPLYHGYPEVTDELILGYKTRVYKEVDRRGLRCKPTEAPPILVKKAPLEEPKVVSIEPTKPKIKKVEPTKPKAVSPPNLTESNAIAEKPSTSSLPQCPASGYMHNCFGKKKYDFWPFEVVYVGEFQNDKRHGYGTMTKRSFKLVGEWKDDYLHGHGTVIYKNGDKFTGQFERGHRKGQGKFVPKTGRILEGFWEGYDLMGNPKLKYERKAGDTDSTQKYANGDVYIGRLKNGKRHGYGTYHYGPKSKTPGQKYVGEWRNGQKYGTGTVTLANGEVLKGTSKNGIFTPDPKIIRKEPEIAEKTPPAEKPKVIDKKPSTNSS